MTVYSNAYRTSWNDLLFAYRYEAREAMIDLNNIASFKFSVGGLAGQVRARARRSEYLTRFEEVG